MRRIVLLALCLLLMGLTGTCLAESQAAGGPRMVLEETSYDFLEADEGAVVEHAFRVENRGDAPLEIRRVNPG